MAFPGHDDPGRGGALRLALVAVEEHGPTQRILTVHVPLAVAIVGLSVWLAIWSWRGLEEGEQA